MKSIVRVLSVSLLVGTFGVTGAALADTLKFKADMKSQSEVPPADSSGSGLADVTVDTSSKKLTWKIDYQGLTGDVVAAHFHGPAKEGENAGPVVDISGAVKEGSADLTDEQLQQLQSGEWYVNLHTAQFPDGEVRGQVVAAQ
jgi:hypothetical protein